MSYGHDHGFDRAGSKHLRPLTITFVLVSVFMVVEIVVGLATGSLALLSDAGHMASDALGVGMALAAIVAANRASARGHRTFGLYRLEIIAALANALLLFLVAGYVIVVAFDRLQDPPEVTTGPVLVVAALGLVVNVIAWRMLREGAKTSINVEGALVEVAADLIGSGGVLVAALLVRYLDWTAADPIFAAAIGVFILPRAWRLGRRALRVLVQAAPEHLDLDELRETLLSMQGVIDVHDLHVWTLTSEMDVASVHLVTSEDTNPHPVLDEARALLEQRYRISHATLQVEPETHAACAEVSW